ncbi:ethionine resistance protein [Polyrhizophydium stewartii]|uniref:Ethionine resistance protein n=1 Tax=Polyrhizophydium stewartii TaxID=2732419 RepID=A0ABR4ND77_9FUNG
MVKRDSERTPLLHQAVAAAAAAGSSTSSSSSLVFPASLCSTDSSVTVDDSPDRMTAQAAEAEENAASAQPEDVHAPITAALVWDETGRIVTLTWPILVGYVLISSLSIASILSLGHVGTKELAASALTTMFCNVTGFSLGMGMNCAMDTLCSQAYTASRDKYALGKHLQRSIVVMVVMSIPISIIWLFTKEILLAFGQDPEISELSGVFARWMLPGLVPYLVGDSIKRYLQTQGIVKASMWVIAIVAPVNIFLQWFLVWSPYAIGIVGAPIATSISNTLICLMTMAYTAWIDGYETWGGWDWNEALDMRQIWIYVKLGVPGIAMVCSEWWAFELVALASGLLGDQALAAQTVVLNTCSLTYIIPMSVSIAISTRIGNSLGAGLPLSSKVVAVTGYALGFVLAMINASFLYIVRDSWGWVYSNDAEVVTIVASVLPLAALFQLSDGLCAIGGGVLRGCGRQHLGAYINLAGYYIAGLPVGLYAGFRLGFGLEGIWFGLTVALVIVSATIGVLVVRTDWSKEVENALALAGHAHGDANRGAYGAIATEDAASNAA